MRWFIAFCVLFFLSCVADAQSAVTGTGSTSLQLSWILPVARENGVALTATEISGVELRYKLKTATEFNSVVLPGNTVRSYEVAGLAAGDYEFYIAVFDTDGLYSNFVSIAYKMNTSGPRPVTNLAVKRQVVDAVETCSASKTCKVVRAAGQ